MNGEPEVDDRPMTVARTTASLQAFEAWLERRVEALGLAPKAAYALRLCLEEAVMNSFTHGDVEGEGEHPIRVWAGLKDGAPAAWIEDDGPPFDPVAAVLPDKPTTLASAEVGGAGLRLMRHYAKHMNYRRIDARNRLELLFEAA